ncbi:WD40-repeat-containing domain protein [Suillus spraguei]|nr:WD40-repeat-containing domain protein [Suillus spraguei]
MAELIPITMPLRTFKGHEDWVTAVAVVPDKRRMVTASDDKTLRLWDLKTGDVLKKMEGHRNWVCSLAVSRDGQLIASGDERKVIIWHGETGESLTKPSKPTPISSLDFSPDGKVLASGSWTKRRNSTSRSIGCGDSVHWVQYSPSGELLAIATDAIFKFIIQAQENASHPSRVTQIQLVTRWTPDGTRLLTGGIRSILHTEWDTSTWQQVVILGGPLWIIYAITVNPLFDQRTIATFSTHLATCVTFSVDGKHILSGGDDKMITEWAIKLMWEDALLDAQKLTHAALHGLQRYDEAIDAFTIMLSKLDHAPEAKVRDLRQQYIHPSQAVWTELEYAPLRLLNTSTGLLCDRAAQMSTFKTSAEYKELLSSTTKHSDLQTGRIKDVVATYFSCVLLSHRWEEMEAVLPDIQDKVVYELNGLGGIAKLQSFCKVARDAGYRWAWMDTCCIDKRSNTEVQESVNSMFVWYRHSALTIVYLSDVPPSSKPGALARSIWNERGWTFQEFVAPKVVIFYQKDWSLYLGDRSPNHKESSAIMKELENATGIDAQALVTFRPGMSAARQKLQWASKRVTTLQEDVAYSLFGIFGITLPVIYGERKQRALGRLLQEIVAQSGDISVLDWIGQLPISSLRESVSTALASKMYDQLEQLSAPRFANCRLHLPCISFRVTEVRRKRGSAEYRIKADGLHDLFITTAETLVQFSRAKPVQQTFLLIRPWDRDLLGVPDFAEQPDSTDDTESIGDWSEAGSPLDDSQLYAFDKFHGGSPVEGEPVYRALRLMVRLGQPFDAFLLAQQRVGEYKRIASDHNIVAQVKDITSVDKMDIRTVEIL